MHTYRDVKLIHIHMKGTHTYIQTDESYTHTYTQRGAREEKVGKELGKKKFSSNGREGGNSVTGREQ